MFPPNWLLRIEKVFQNEVACVQGTQQYRGESPGLEPQGEFYLKMLQKKRGLDTKNLAVRRNLILKHKFDEAMRYAGDREFGVRLALNQIMVKYDPNIWVVHAPNYSFKNHISRVKNWGTDYAYIHQIYGWTYSNPRLRYPFPILFFFYLASSLYFLLKFRSFRGTIAFTLTLLVQALYFKISVRKKRTS